MTDPDTPEDLTADSGKRSGDDWVQKDRRTGFRRKGDLTRAQVKRWLILLSWATVIGYIVAIVLSISFTHIVSRTNNNANAGQQAICAVILYAEDAVEAAKSTANVEAVDRLRKLAEDMRATGVACPPHKP